MSAEARKAFLAALRERLNPLLHELGFRGSGQHFARIRGEVINAVNIQGSRYADGCFLNLGLHFSFLPANRHLVPTPMPKWKEIDCEFRWRVNAPANRDGMWRYSLKERETIEEVARLAGAYLAEGEPMFERFSSTAAVSETITLETLRQGRFHETPWRSTRVREALTMARIHAHLGSPRTAAEFARFGLENLGAATGLRSSLEALAGAA